MNTTHNRTLTTLLFGILIGALAMLTMVILGHASRADAERAWTPPPRTHWMRTPCPQEEFVTNCAWNARIQGEGHGGYSYYSVTRKVFNLDGVWNGRRVVCIYYPQRRIDRQFSACHLLPKGDRS